MTEMSTKYNPTEVEQNRYNWWWIILHTRINAGLYQAL